MYEHCPYCGAEWYIEGDYKNVMALYDLSLDITIAYKCLECEGEVWRNGELKDGPDYSLSNHKSIKP